MTDFKPSERDDGLIDWITDFDILDESYVEEPAAGKGVFQRTFFVSLHSSGKVSATPTPSIRGPRQ